MRRTKFMLRSAETGAGKTRQAIADMCNVSCDMIYDYKKGWVKNGIPYPSLFISTELEKREVQTIMLAFISGIDDEIIKNGRYSEKVAERLKIAIEVLKRAPIYCVYIDDFTISDIEMIIERHIIEHNVQFVAFDYIQITPKLAKSMANIFGSSLREDQILVQFSAAMKSLANKYDIYITSSTQLNRNAKDENLRDAAALRGGSSTADKPDFGINTFKVTSRDLDNIKHILERGFFERPNYAHWVYKNRGGRDKVIIWTKMNLGTVREVPLFVTDWDYNFINDIQPINIDFDKDQNEIKEETKKEMVLNF
jgi:replicative DNA helicase